MSRLHVLRTVLASELCATKNDKMHFLAAKHSLCILELQFLLECENVGAVAQFNRCEILITIIYKNRRYCII